MKTYFSRPSALLTKTVFLLLPLAVIAQNHPDGTCYFPSGIVAQNYFPCDPTAFITQCCPVGWTCYSNSLCVVTDPRTSNATVPLGTTRRAGCTNALWNNKICGDFCLASQNDNGSMSACGDNTFCCDGDKAAGNCSCNNRVGVVSVPAGPVQTVLFISAGVTSTSSFVYQSSTSTPAGSSTVSPTSSATSSPTSSPDEKKKPSAGLIAGVVIAAVVVAAIFGFLIYKWRTHEKRERVVEEGDDAPYFIPDSAPATHAEPRPGMAQNNGRGGRNGLNPFSDSGNSRSTTPAHFAGGRHGLGSGTTLDRSEY